MRQYDCKKEQSSAVELEKRKQCTAKFKPLLSVSSEMARQIMGPCLVLPESSAGVRELAEYSPLVSSFWIQQKVKLLTNQTCIPSIFHILAYGLFLPPFSSAVTHIPQVIVA